MNCRHLFFRVLMSTALLLVVSIDTPALSQVVGRPTPLGTNLSKPSAFSTQWDFVDLMKGSNPWTYVGGPNSGQLTPIDSLGNPLLATGEQAETLPRLEIVNSFQDRTGKFPSGQYTITWEGDGQFFLSGDGDFERIFSGQTGSRPFNAASGEGNLYLKIESSNPSNPLRNIRMLAPGYGPGQSGEGQSFHQTFLDRNVIPYSMYRFTEWSEAPYTTHGTWSERTPDGANQYTVESGVPIEEQLRLVNSGNGSAWFTMPTHADDDYVTRFAQSVLYGIDANGNPYTSPQANPHVAPVPADRTIYLEYGNEVWNSEYAGSSYIIQEGIAAGLSPSLLNPDFAKQWAVEVRRDFDLWTTEFAAAGQTDRLKRVAAIQGPNRFISPIFLDEMTVNGVPQFDVISPAFYVGVNSGAYNASTTKDDIIDDLYAKLADLTDPTITTFLPGNIYEVIGPAGDWLLWKQFADDYGVELTAYEGGQHLTIPAISSSWHGAYMEAHRDDRMYDFYTDLLEAIFDTVEADGMAAFSSVALISQWGGWGALEYQDQDIADAPKYRAMIDFMKNRGDFVSDGIFDDKDIDSLRAFFGATPTGILEMLDLNEDGQIDQADTIFLVEQRIKTSLGDADLDGDVDLADLERLLANEGTPGGWYDGDFNGDAAVDSNDALLWRQNTSLVGIGQGDYNADGIVDAADYTLFRDQFGSALDLRADGDGNGIVDLADFLLWKNNFGTSVSEATLVPEPSGAFLLLLAGSSLRIGRQLKDKSH